MILWHVKDGVRQLLSTNPSLGALLCHEAETAGGQGGNERPELNPAGRRSPPWGAAGPARRACARYQRLRAGNDLTPAGALPTPAPIPSQKQLSCSTTGKRGPSHPMSVPWRGKLRPGARAPATGQVRETGQDPPLPATPAASLRMGGHLPGTARTRGGRQAGWYRGHRRQTPRPMPHHPLPGLHQNDLGSRSTHHLLQEVPHPGRASTAPAPTASPEP